MKYENFNDFFSSLNIDNDNIISKWEALSKRKRKISRITIIIMLIVDALLLIYGFKFSIFIVTSIFIADIFIFIIMQIISGNKDIVKFNNDYKKNVINNMLKNFIEELDYIPLKGMPNTIYNEAHYGGYYNKYYSDDYFEGKIDGQKIIMADLLVQEETTEKDEDGNKTTETTIIFNGLFGKIELNKSINSNLNITRCRSFSLLDSKRLEMDYSEFEKFFNVYTNNNIIAMQLLTPDIQEDILELYNKYKVNFHIFITNNQMYILFNTGNMFEVFSSKNTPTQVLEKYFDIMKFIYKLVDKLLITIDNTQI